MEHLKIKIIARLANKAAFHVQIQQVVFLVKTNIILIQIKIVKRIASHIMEPIILVMRLQDHA